MDMTEFKETFIKESKNNINYIDNYLNILKNNYDIETMNNLKREFHTLKGNSATMKYNKFFEISKSLNDLSCLIIDEKLSFNEELLLIFNEGKKILLNALECIEKEDSENFNDYGIINKINKFILLFNNIT
jgi:chemotaxis protein histidine kinase CheA